MVVVDLLDDELEGLEELMTGLVLFYLDDVDAHRDDVGPNLVGRDAEVDSTDVAINCEWRSAPRHGATTRSFSNDDVFVSFVTHFYAILRGSIDLLLILFTAVWRRHHNSERILKSSLSDGFQRC